jgi:transcription elongation factor Elf1
MTISPFEPSEVVRLLRKVSCPVCSGEKIDVTWVEGGMSSLEGTAVCGTCGFAFQLLADLGRLLEEEEGLSVRLSRSVCPDCEAGGGTLLGRCDLSSGDRFYLLVCSKCGFPYKEFASLPPK